MRTRWLLGAALLITTALYWPGLHGPYLLDDFYNLRPLQQWLAGDASWQSVVFGNDSGMLGRSLPMASFLLNAVLAGSTDSFSFKLGNLLLHLLCGLTGYAVLRRVLELDTRLAMHAASIAAVLAALWCCIRCMSARSVRRAAHGAAGHVVRTGFAMGYLAARQQLIQGLRDDPDWACSRYSRYC